MLAPDSLHWTKNGRRNVEALPFHGAANGIFVALASHTSSRENMSLSPTEYDPT
jgi:hypothetical protein